MTLAYFDILVVLVAPFAAWWACHVINGRQSFPASEPGVWFVVLKLKVVVEIVEGAEVTRDAAEPRSSCNLPCRKMAVKPSAESPFSSLLKAGFPIRGML